jgi:hypothetical protein
MELVLKWVDAYEFFFSLRQLFDGKYGGHQQSKLSSKLPCKDFLPVDR